MEKCNSRQSFKDTANVRRILRKRKEIAADQTNEPARITCIWHRLLKSKIQFNTNTVDCHLKWPEASRQGNLERIETEIRKGGYLTIIMR